MNLPTSLNLDYALTVIADAFAYIQNIIAHTYHLISNSLVNIAQIVQWIAAQFMKILHFLILEGGLWLGLEKIGTSLVFCLILVLAFLFISRVLQNSWVKLKKSFSKKEILTPEDQLDRRELINEIIGDLKKDLLEYRPSKKYAIIGKWGCGKTWLVNHIFKQSKELKHSTFEQVYVNCSLFKDHLQLIHKTSEVIYLQSWPAKIRWVLKIIFYPPALKIVLSKLRLEKLHPSEVLQEGEVDYLYRCGQKLRNPLIIVFDDIDRMDPHEIPLFLSKLMVFDVPNVLMYLVFDQKVIDKSIKEHHLAWNDSEQFLLKMFNFSYDVEENGNVWDYFEKSAHQAGFCDESLKYLSEIKKISILKTPREAEHLLQRLERIERGMKPIPIGGQSYASAYDILTHQEVFGSVSGSFYNCFVLYRMLKMVNPKVFKHIEEYKFRHGLYDILSKDNRELLFKKLEKDSEVSLDEETKKLCEELVDSYSYILGFVNDFEKIMLHADVCILDKVHQFTEKGNLESFEKVISCPNQSGLFDMLVSMYRIKTSALANTAYLAKQHFEEAKKTLRILELLKARIAEFMDGTDSEERFERLLKVFNNFPHFCTNSGDKQLRNKEEDFLTTVIKSAANPQTLMQKLDIEESHISDSHKAAVQRNLRIIKRVSKDLSLDVVSSEFLLHRLYEENLKESLTLNTPVGKILLDSSGKIWRPHSEIWSMKLEGLIIQNIERICWFINDRPDLKNTFYTKAFAKRMWKFLTQEEWQYRTQSNLGNLRFYLSKGDREFADKHLPQPRWVKNPTFNQKFEARA